MSNTFNLKGVVYNKEFAFIFNGELRFRGKDYQVKKGFTELRIEQEFGNCPGKFVIFTAAKDLEALRENSTVDLVENDKGLYIIETPNFRFVNFNKIGDCSKIKQLREKYKIEGEKDLDLMENFIKFLLGFEVSYQTLATKWLTGIQREIFYSGLSKEDLNFKDKRFNLMRSSEEGKRTFVYEYLKKTCESSGIMETTVGEFENVISFDVSSLYPYILIAFPFMVEDPYPYFYYGKEYEGKWDYLPIKFRKRILEFYGKKEDGTTGKFYKLCLNSLNGKSISEYENRKDNQNKNNFLAPQHGFQVIEIGRRILTDMEEKLKREGAIILEKDTDSVKFQLDEEKAREILEEENRKVIERLIRSGLSFKEAKCGIGQWKFEYKAEKFIQTAGKRYSYCVNGKWVVKGDRDETFTISF